MSDYFTGVELLNGDRGLPAYLLQPNSEYRKRLPNAIYRIWDVVIISGVRLWGISFIVERETTQTAS